MMQARHGKLFLRYEMKPVTPDVNLPDMENELLADWQAHRTFERSVEQRQGQSAKEFTFYDGPPFANGLPHYGHLLANTIKDTVPRYWAMRGFHVERRFGWDCHGLPVEFEIEKRDGLKGRADILKMGVAKFNEECRASVQHYTKEWQRTITRLGRWVDWSNQYRTMDRNFMESVWWVFSELHKKGLVYRDFKVVPYSPRITAVLSNFEANQNYKDVQDPAVTVKFKLLDQDGAFMLAWTTTPWTLISNVALCVGPDIDYVLALDDESGERFWLAEARLAAVFRKGQTYQVLRKAKGSELKGVKYEPLFPYFENLPNAFRVLNDAYVSTDDGTGVVHQAPAFGEDDFRVCRANGIELVDPVDEEGKFKAEIPEYAGQFVKDADAQITRDLKVRGLVLRSETIFHSYPFCERTDAPLIYKAIRTWYVAVEKVKDKLVANNQTINWVPEHLRDGRMGKWLENARDWAISRNRFWGTPIPIWMCDKDDKHIEVLGSVAALEAKAGEAVPDLHSHFIDKYTFKCPQCAGTMKRISDVFDCWFESGSMPYAQNHYPFENQERFQKRFPADFIAEGLDQTRGWFYTLAVLSAALFDRAAFRNVVVNGLVLAEDGKKMSKRLKNYTSPDLLLDRFGADSVRLYMLNSSILKAEDLCFTDQGVRDTTRAVILPLWNAYSFLSTYAAADGWTPKAQRSTPPKHELDRWIVSRFQTLCARVNTEMQSYRLYAVVPQVLSFIEDLTNWYIRLSRKRFWGTDSTAEGGDDSVNVAAAAVAGAANIEEASEAYQTLFEVLLGFVKVFAPFAPFLSDRLYKNLTDGLTGLPDSVHLCDIPLPNEALIDQELEERMDLLRRTAILGRSLRAKHQIKTRQALPSMLVITRHPSDSAAIERGRELLRSELNVKDVLFTTNEAQYVRLSLKPNLKTLGKRLGKQLNEMRTHLEALSKDSDQIVSLLAELEERGQVTVLGHALTEEDFLIERGPKDDRLIATEKGLTVLLDTRLTEELINEGLAREVISRVQRLRKESGLAVSDRISLVLWSAAKVTGAALAFKDYIAAETLATRIDVRDGVSKAEGQHVATFEIDGAELGVGLSVVP